VGFTERHPLRLSTLRLWSWREEFGAESEWSEQLGGMLVRGGPDSLWSAVTHPAFISEGDEPAEGRNEGGRR
jgi:acyl-CoA dehydrogenase